MMGSFFKVVDRGFFLLIFINACAALPLCIDSRAPHPSKSPLSFCHNDGYEKNRCCSSQEDMGLKSKLTAMNVTDTKCSAFLKQILCAECDQYAADLFQIQLQEQRSVPVLCNSSLVTNSSRNNRTEKSYCSQLWDACQNVPIVNSPFTPSLKGGASGSSTNGTRAKLIELWQSENDFCMAFGGTIIDGVSCFDGNDLAPNVTQYAPPIDGVCLKRIENSSYLDMVAHPDGSNRVFLASQTGQVWLATLPDDDTGKVMELNKSSPFIDLSDRVISDQELGLLGLAFHPNFEKNGRFFASFNCDKTKHPNCAGRCACNADVGCDPSQIISPGTTPCQYQSVIAEFTVNDTSTSPNVAEFANPVEVRRIFTMGLPYANHHGGQILFGPKDNYLYFMMGDGSNAGDPYNFAQNKKSLLGKTMRLDIDDIPSVEKITNLGLWGNYSIPSDNPYSQVKDWQPEIWALGLRNPWRCSFDSLKSSYFFCGDVGQDTYEEVELITKGGNYGWRVYEGMNLYTPLSSPGGNTSASSIEPIFPILGYYHKTVSSQGSASIVGGYLSRSNQDPCLYGRYVYADLFGANMWSAIENPIGSGNFSNQKVDFNCSAKSPIPCSYSAQNTYPGVGNIFSFGEDNGKNLYLLTDSGVYRVVHPSDCNFVCSITGLSNASEPSPSPSESQSPLPSSIPIQRKTNVWLMFFLFLIYILLE